MIMRIFQTRCEWLWLATAFEGPAKPCRAKSVVYSLQLELSAAVSVVRMVNTQVSFIVLLPTKGVVESTCWQLTMCALVCVIVYASASQV